MSKLMLWGVAMAIALGCGLSYAATIEPQLQQTLQAANPSEMFPVNFVMKAQTNALALDASIEQLPKPQRRARVGRVMMDFTEASQRDLIRALNSRATDGKVDDIKPLWIVNMVGCWATKDVIYEMAARSDVQDVLYGKVPVELGEIDLKNIVVPTDGVQPNLVTTNARGAWKQGYTGQNIVVGVVDTGVRYTHLDLTGHLWTSTAYPNCGFNFASSQYTKSGHGGPSSYDTLTPLDYYGHGTHCAGIVAANGAYGNGTRDTMGVAPSAKIMSCPVDVYLHSPYPDTSMENNTLAGMQFCVRPDRDTLNGADVITMSLGLITGWAPRYAVWRIAERNILIAGIPHMVAAGNEGASGIRTSGNCPPPWRNPVNHPTGSGHENDTCVTAVITIGATDNNDAIANFSSLGPTTIWGTTAPFNDYLNPPGLMDPDLCMPGVSILSTYNSGDMAYTTMSGTSMATPGAAGVVALMLSKNPNLKPLQIDSILELYCVIDLGTSGKDNTFGAGRINCSLAVAFTPPPITNDVGIVRIITPTGLMDSSAITPACTVRNYGSATANYTVRMKIGAGYDNTAAVAGHPSYTSQVVTFPAFNGLPRGGPYPVSCSTVMTPDEIPANNRATSTVTIQVRDVYPTMILAPTGIVDSGATVTPACSIFNRGSVSETYTVRAKIGTAYDQTVSVSGHATLGTVYVTFPDWLALERGNLVVSCSTELGADKSPENDKLVGSVLNRVLDVGVVAITTPTGSVDSGGPILPQALIHNYGSITSTFNVQLTIDDGYTSTVPVTVDPGAESTATFAAWLAPLRGLRALKCTTLLAGDVISGNDWKSRNTFVNVHDVGVLEIITPSGAVPPGAVAPQARVHNFGTRREAVAFTFQIVGGSYQRTFVCGNGVPLLVDTTITFPNWTAVNGAYTSRCSVYLATDQVRGNDVLEAGFSVGGSVDVGVAGIVRPAGTATPFTYVKPQIRLHNYSTMTVSNVRTSFDITRGTLIYSDTVMVASIASGADAVVDFPDSVYVDTGAVYTTLAKHYYNDGNPANNQLAGSFIGSFAAPGWTQKTDMPTGAKGKKIKDGGSLAYDGSFIYAFKGNGRCEFYAYNTSDNTWATKESIPAVGSSGKKKAVKKGATLAYAEGSIYGAKGNGTLEWWKYTPGKDAGTWTEAALVPAGAKTLKEGVGSATVKIGETTYIYLLKGSGTMEYYRYNTLRNAWEAATSAPAGASGKTYKNGSALAASADGKTVFVLKGSYNEFAAYTVDSGTWTAKTALPFIGTSGKKKKAKDGAGMAYLNGTVYALKGGNTREFWSYKADSGIVWVQKEDMPVGGGKNVKGGGALVTGGSLLYALKGNNNFEFYTYNPPAVAYGLPLTDNDNAMSNSTSGMRRATCVVSPNPFSNSATISYTLPEAGNATLRLYDVTGKLVGTLASGYHKVGTSSFIVSRSSLASGIYLLKLATENTTTTTKLIIE